MLWSLQTFMMRSLPSCIILNINVPQKYTSRALLKVNFILNSFPFLSAFRNDWSSNNKTLPVFNSSLQQTGIH